MGNPQLGHQQNNSHNHTNQMSDAWQVEPHAIIPELEPDYPAQGFTVAQHIDPQLAAQLRQLAAINTKVEK